LLDAPSSFRHCRHGHQTQDPFDVAHDISPVPEIRLKTFDIIDICKPTPKRPRHGKCRAESISRVIGPPLPFVLPENRQRPPAGSSRTTRLGVARCVGKSLALRDYSMSSKKPCAHILAP